MFAVDIRVSPLVPLTAFLSHAIFLYAIIDLALPLAAKFPLALGAGASLFIALRHCSAGRPSRVRRFIITRTKSLLINQREGSSGAEIMERAVPSLVRCGEFLIILRFDSVERGGRPVTLRLWPGSLSRRDASLLRRYLAFAR